MRTAFNILEKILMSLLIVSFSSLLFMQIFKYNDDSINTSNTSINIPFINKGETIKKGAIKIKNLDKEYTDVNVLVNGEYVCDFSESDEVEITVYHNDIVEIDGSNYDDSIYFKIVGVSTNIDNPKLDTILTTSHSIEILGKVILK